MQEGDGGCQVTPPPPLSHSPSQDPITVSPLSCTGPSGRARHGGRCSCSGTPEPYPQAAHGVVHHRSDATRVEGQGARRGEVTAAVAAAAPTQQARLKTSVRGALRGSPYPWGGGRKALGFKAHQPLLRRQRPRHPPSSVSRFIAATEPPKAIGPSCAGSGHGLARSSAEAGARGGEGLGAPPVVEEPLSEGVGPAGVRGGGVLGERALQRVTVRRAALAHPRRKAALENGSGRIAAHQ